MRTSTKRVNIISLEIKDNEGKILQRGGIIMRTTRSYAQRAVEAGTHKNTSKGKLKSYLNKSQKLLRNEKFLKVHTNYGRVEPLGKQGKKVVVMAQFLPVGARHYAQVARVASYSSMV